MATVGGGCLEVVLKNPTLGSVRFIPMGGEAGTLDLGGYRTNDEGTGITASGEAVYQMTNNRWSFEIPCAGDMNSREDLENLSALTADLDECECTISFMNGTVYRATGKPVGDAQQDTMAATFTLKIAGGGGCEKIA